MKASLVPSFVVFRQQTWKTEQRMQPGLSGTQWQYSTTAIGLNARNIWMRWAPLNHHGDMRMWIEGQREGKTPPAEILLIQWTIDHSILLSKEQKPRTMHFITVHPWAECNHWLCGFISALIPWLFVLKMHLNCSELFRNIFGRS